MKLDDVTILFAACGCWVVTNGGRVTAQQATDATNDVEGSGDDLAWWQFGLSNPVLDEVALYYLGQTWFQAADVSEVLETVYRVKNNSDNSWGWTMEWRKTAERLEKLAAQHEDEGNVYS